MYVQNINFWKTVSCRNDFVYIEFNEIREQDADKKQEVRNLN